MKKRILFALLALSCVFAMASCGGKKGEGDSKTEEPSASATAAQSGGDMEVDFGDLLGQ